MSVCPGTLISHYFRFSSTLEEPYLHVAYFFLGAWAGNAYVRFERELVDDVNTIRENKGLPRMVGTSGWIRYSAMTTPPQQES